MRRVMLAAGGLAWFAMAGCSGTPEGGDGGTIPGNGSVERAPAPIMIKNGSAPINAANSIVEFVGTKPGGSHTGGFSAFHGEIKVDPETQHVAEITVDLQTKTLWTDTPRLTDHLKSVEFFNVDEYLDVKFRSSKIEPTDAEQGEIEITGDLTLLDVTGEITFPATAKIEDGKLSLHAEFSIDRTRFGMTWNDDPVDNMVKIAVDVGVTPPTRAENTPGLPGMPAGGEENGGDERGGVEGRRGGEGRRRGFDPAARFDEWDANGDEKLTGDEIPDFMQRSLEQVDADEDAAVTLDEMQEWFRQFRGRRGRGGNGRGRGRDGADLPPLT